MKARVRKKRWRRSMLWVRRNMRRARGSHLRLRRTVEHGWTYSTTYVDMVLAAGFDDR